MLQVFYTSYYAFGQDDNRALFGRGVLGASPARQCDPLLPPRFCRRAEWYSIDARSLWKFDHVRRFQEPLALAKCLGFMDKTDGNVTFSDSLSSALKCQFVYGFLDRVSYSFFSVFTR